jgi:metal-sulfur cluster biosynthetic enzyme
MKTKPRISSMLLAVALSPLSPSKTLRAKSFSLANQAGCKQVTFPEHLISPFFGGYSLPMSTLPSTESIREKLREVLDPELFISIVDLGLVYDISVSPEGVASILMTLTTIGCPLFDTIQTDIRERVLSLEGITDVTVSLTFDPPWEPAKMSDFAKAELGIE